MPVLSSIRPLLCFYTSFFSFYFLFQTCRHVILPTDVARLCPKNKLLSETEWRQLGVQQSRGWEHYAVHKYVPNSATQLCVRCDEYDKPLHGKSSWIDLDKCVWIVDRRLAQPCAFGKAKQTFSYNFLCRPEPHILLFRRPNGTDPVNPFFVSSIYVVLNSI